MTTTAAGPRTVLSEERYTNCERNARFYSGATVRQIVNGTYRHYATDSTYQGTNPVADSQDNRLFYADRDISEFDQFSIAELDGAAVLYRDARHGRFEFALATHLSPAEIDRSTIQAYTVNATGTSSYQSVGESRSDPGDDVAFSFVHDAFSFVQTIEKTDASGLPTVWRMRMNGTERFQDPHHPELSYAGQFQNLTVTIREQIDNGQRLELRSFEGRFTPACLGVPVTVTTLSPLVAAGPVCFEAGALQFQLPSGVVTVHYTANREMEIDLNADGVVDVRRSHCSELFGGLC